jgi:hypothetical protein
MLVVPSFAGGWIAVQTGFATLGFGSAHQMLDKKPEPVCIVITTKKVNLLGSSTGSVHLNFTPPRTCVFAYKFGGMICPHLLIQVFLYS